MSHFTISRDQIKHFSAFSKAFRDQQDFKDFLSTPFTSLSDLVEQARKKSIVYPKDTRAVLVKRWRNQIEQVASESQLAHLDLLEKDTTFTITTGHQLTLFGGPLYLIYKVLHVVKLAESFNQSQQEFKAVPVFWMASEDHDFDEVKYTHLFNQKLTWDTPQTGPVGRFEMNDFNEVKGLFNQLFEGKENEIRDLLTITAQGNYASYLQLFLTKLFADYGVLVLNPDQHEFKKIFKPIILRELESAGAHQAVQHTNKSIETLGFKPQAQSRACNLFYLQQGQRLRIEPVANGFAIDGTIYSLEELVKLVEKEPENFSPNVILRPVYQETILPNLAYIGGGGEMAYWIQLKGVFEHHQTLYPLILQRVSFQLVDQAMQKRLDKLGWDEARFFEAKEALRKEYLKENEADDLDLSSLQHAYNQLKSEMIAKAKQIEATLESFAEAESVRMKKQLDAFEQRLLKQVKQRHEQQLQAIDFVSDRIIPENTLQERYFHWLQFAPSGEYKKLFCALYTSFEPLEKELVVVRL